MEDRIVVLEIKDTEYGDVLKTYYLKNPDMKKLEYLQYKVSRRFDDYEQGIENEFYDDFGSISDYVRKNFEVIDTTTEYTVWW